MSSQQSYTLHFDMITEPETANLLMTSVLHVITLPIVRLHSRKAQGGPQNVNRLYFVRFHILCKQYYKLYTHCIRETRRISCIAQYIHCDYHSAPTSENALYTV